MAIRIFYSSHSVDPLKLRDEKTASVYMSQVAPQSVQRIVQSVYNKSVLRMQQALVLGVVNSLNTYTSSGQLEFDEKKIIDFEGEVQRFLMILEHTLPPEHFKLFERDSVRATMCELLTQVRRSVTGSFSSTFNSLAEAFGEGMYADANLASACIVTFLNRVPDDTQVN